MTQANNEYDIISLAEFISEEYCHSGAILPELIAKSNKILVFYNDYKDCFDGLLEHDGGRFFIYINTHNIYNPQHPRVRFTLAHELGHYFLDEHRNSLAKGNSLHTSMYMKKDNLAIEREANLFASHLLMPSERFNSFIKGKVFNSSLLQSLTEFFLTSYYTTILQCINLDIRPLMCIFSTNNLISYSKCTNDFPYRQIASIRHEVPINTVAWEYFNSGTQYQSDEIVYSDDWFTIYRNEDMRVEMNERCFYYPNNSVLSMIWMR